MTQIEFWNGAGGRRWVEQQPELDPAMRPFGEMALLRALVRAGEHVLDVGSGCGDTTLALARLVGVGGRVCGIDVSAPMVAIARERAAALSQVRIIEADAVEHAFHQVFDLIYSRFGLMFFEDVRAAFCNLRAALKDTGRLAFVCWRDANDNPWYSTPLDVVRNVWPDAPAVAVDDGPGPFAFASEDKVRRILENAGFGDIQIERYDTDVVMGSGSLTDAVHFALTAGPAARILNDAAPSVVEEVRIKMVGMLQPLLANGRSGLRGSTWVVTAQAE